MVVMVPIPSAMADPVMMMERVGHADMNAEIADMRARADTARPRADSRAHRTDLRARADLSMCGARKSKRNREYRSRQRFHFQIFQGGRQSNK